MALLLVLVALAACGEGNGSGGGSEGRDQSTGSDGAQNGGGEGGGGGGTSESEDTLTTELDLGQAFAEDPSFQSGLGPVEISAIAPRDTQSMQLPIEFRVSNPSATRLDAVSVAIMFQVLPGPDPEDPPVPGEDAPPLAMSPQASQGQCSEGGATPSQATVSCEVGALEGGSQALITVVSPDWFNLSVGVTVRASQ